MRYTFIILLLGLCFGCDAKKHDDHTLFDAVKKGDIERVRIMADSESNFDVMDQWGYNALRYVRDERIAKILLEGGANPNHISPNDPDQQTPLHYLSISFDSSPSIVQLLVDAGADPNIKDAHGKAPVDYLNEIAEAYPNNETYKRKLKLLTGNGVR